jgi:hypothetical protein
VHHGLLRAGARVGHEELRREVVRALDDHVDPLEELVGEVREKTRGSHGDFGPRAAGVERALGDLGLGQPDVPVAEEDLPVQVRHLDLVVVDEHEPPDPCADEGERRGAPEPADAHDEHGLGTHDHGVRLPGRRTRGKPSRATSGGHPPRDSR